MQVDSDYEYEGADAGLSEEWETAEDEREAFLGEEEGEDFDVPFTDEPEWETESPFDDAEEMELAAELLSVANTAGLDHFLGKVLRRGFHRRRLPVSASVARSLFAKLRPLAGRIARAGGCACGGRRGRLASRTGRAFGLELEGLSPEDQEFEVARGVVRVMGAAAAKAAEAPPSAPPADVSKAAVAAAVRAHAPGLAAGMPPAPLGGRRRGRWVRRGRKIVVLGV